MRTEKIKLANPKFAFVQGNRAVDEKRLEKAILEAGRVLIPIYGVFYGDIKDIEINIFDAVTGELLDTPSDDYFVVLDGQHRTKTSLKLFSKMQEQLKDSDETNALVCDFSETIPATVLESEDLKGVNPLSLIMNINTTSKSWSSKDFAKSAYERKKDDDIVSIICWLSELRFSISNISRILFFDHKALNNRVLAEYSNGNGELPECNLSSKLELLRMLIRIGFSMNFLRKRYLYEAIIKKNNAQKYDNFVSALSQLDEKTINQIEHLSPTDCDNGKIIATVDSFAKNNGCSRDASAANFDLSETRLKDNLDFFCKKVEEVKNKPHKVKGAEHAKGVTSKPNVNADFENLTVDDVV